MEHTLHSEEPEVEEVVEQPKKEFGFDLSKFRYDGPWPVPMPKEENCTVLNGRGAKALSLLSGNDQPILAMTRDVWNEVRHLVGIDPGREVAMFLILKQFSSLVPKFLAVDLFLPEQEVGHGGVSVDGDGITKFYEDLNAHEDYSEHMHRRLCHLHSHGRMGVFWSAADTNQQLSRDDLAYFDDYRFYVVVNVRGEVRVSFCQYRPFTRRFDNLPLVIVGKDEGLTDERKLELEEMYSERVKPMKAGENVFEGIRTFSPLLTEEYGKPPAAKYYVDDGDDEDIDLGALERRAGEDRCYKERNPDASYVGGSFADEFVYWCMVEPVAGVEFSNEEIRRMIAEIGKHEDGKRLAETLWKLDPDDRRSFFSGYSDFVQGTRKELETILPWFLLMDYSFLLKNQLMLSRLTPFLQAPMEDC